MRRATRVLVALGACALGAAPARALTLSEAIARVGEVHPDVVVAEHAAAMAGVRTGRAWAGLAPDVSFTQVEQLSPAVATDIPRQRLRARWQPLDASGALEGARRGAEAVGARAAVGATTLDARYAAAALYHQALAGDARVQASTRGLRIATATRDLARTRVEAGVEGELVLRTAELGVLEAGAMLADAQAQRAVARARLTRALQQPIEGDLVPAPPPEDPDGGTVSPWLDVARADVRSARLRTMGAWAQYLPTGGMQATQPVGVAGAGWTVNLQLRWQADGLIAPMLLAREQTLARRVAETQLDALERDLALAVEVARAQARGAQAMAEAARARETLAEGSLALGQTRLTAGVSTPLEVLRLQDDATRARQDRVEAELALALARLEARRARGVPIGEE